MLLALNAYLDNSYWERIYIWGDSIRLFAQAKNAGSSKLIICSLKLGEALDGLRIEFLAGFALDSLYAAIVDEN